MYLKKLGSKTNFSNNKGKAEIGENCSEKLINRRTKHERKYKSHYQEKTYESKLYQCQTEFFKKNYRKSEFEKVVCEKLMSVNTKKEKVMKLA